jgi:hypothetical protein
MNGSLASKLRAIDPETPFEEFMRELLPQMVEAINELAEVAKRAELAAAEARDAARAAANIATTLTSKFDELRAIVEIANDSMLVARSEAIHAADRAEHAEREVVSATKQMRSERPTDPAMARQAKQTEYVRGPDHHPGFDSDIPPRGTD